MPYVAPAPNTVFPLEATVIAEVIICALQRHEVDRRYKSWIFTHQVKSMEQTRVTWPVTLAHPVIQLANGPHFGGASFAEK